MTLCKHFLGKTSLMYIHRFILWYYNYGIYKFCNRHRWIEAHVISSLKVDSFREKKFYFIILLLLNTTIASINVIQEILIIFSFSLSSNLYVILINSTTKMIYQTFSRSSYDLSIPSMLAANIMNRLNFCTEDFVPVSTTSAAERN